MNAFFVDRPIFAWVVALFVLLFGGIALWLLPVEQYPNIAPPSITVNATYHGADTTTIDRTVTSVIESEMNGVDDLLYLASVSRANGTAQITVTLLPGTDLDIARGQVQDRLSRVEPRLPAEVRQLGVTVTKASSGFLMLIALQSDTDGVSAVAMGNFVSNNVLDELRRIPGVGDVQLFGSSYAMRIWVDQRKLDSFRLSSGDVMRAVQEQNAQTASGALGDQPLADGVEFNAPIITQSQLSTPAEFRRIILRVNPDGSTVTVGDVAHVELGNENYGFRLSVNGKPAAGIAIQLANDANALAVAQQVRERMAELESVFPQGVSWSVPFDTTPFIVTSVRSVMGTMVEALLLVTVMVFLFLQSWRATLVPTVIVPVALIGTCAGLYLFGASINLLSLFGMVVAIGILNDDAIVVSENVSRIMNEDQLDARDATRKAVAQVWGPVVASTLVLVAVFVPMAMFPGSSGAIYRQFSITLAVSIVISTVLALSLGGALCATLFRPAPPRTHGRLARAKYWVFDRFNHGFDRLTASYARALARMLKYPVRWLLAFLAVCGLTILLFSRIPGGYLPSEDQGYFFVSYTGAPGATAERTEAAVTQAEAYLRRQPEVRNVASVVGFSFFGQGQTAALSFVDLYPWADRERSVDALVSRSNAAFFTIPQAQIFALNPPPIPSMGNAAGFSLKVQDRSGQGGAGLSAAASAMMAAAAQSPVLAGIRLDGMPPAPQLYVEVDRIHARALGVQLGQVNQALALAFGANYVNDFLHDGNVLRVFMQADAAQRMSPQDVMDMQLLNDRGELVPMSAFARSRWISGPQQLERYNGFPAITLSGQGAPGQSSGNALLAMETIADAVLPPGMTYEWTGTAFEERQAGNQVALLLALSLVVVFLLLSALYESWSVPISVLLVLPFGVLGAAAFTLARGMSADIYFNIGLVTIIGLAAKNGILIVEFALKEEQAGRPRDEAVLDAARQRLRPIIMTSVTFVLGMLPLVFATGAGAASRQAVGTSVMGSMLTATIFGVFFTPLFYVATRKWLGRRSPAGAAPKEAP
ncbi:MULTISPECIES: multidrug efflux RND transporter permease subunit [Achromobacter]|uniref:Efflux pump membrane transporter n=1 Tax=Achromobacter spanius TaxID=217203 RepID=A0ABY8GQC7_9BURK|nr:MULTISPECIES: multidrug efflux RND transporter permease subunit [Achromobacter]WAI83953.1 multidrug efflux RND transporter permease subunit [Achromobacter spanius]WEX94034.1 multidrug efflux RND transporter permease subunit [Achromobacter sp. SS2-2022]WFP06804.1 multidrug efflux RND transporter permease subunit [Achromobacter spanius]